MVVNTGVNTIWISYFVLEQNSRDTKYARNKDTVKKQNPSQHNKCNVQNRYR